MKFPRFLLLTSLLILASPGCLQPATSKPHNFTDLESLLAFKSLADPNGILDANWTTNTTFCSWIGVQCNSRRQRVTVIRLQNFTLQEYATTGTLSRMSDVYSFGILLLETFTGKKPVDDMFNGESNLREWVSKAHPDAIFDVVDYKLLKDHAEDDGPLQDQTIIHQCLMSIIELGMLCSAYTPKERIPMTEVAARLRKIKVEYLSNLSN